MIKFFLRQFKERAGLRKVASNSVWIMIDNIIRIVGGFLIGLWVARYLGPYQYGQLNYAIFFTGMFSIIATSAFNGIVAREIINRPKEKNKIMGAAFFIKLIGALAASLAVIAVIGFVHQDSTTKILIAFYTLAIFFQSVDIIIYWFQATLKSNFYVIAKNVAFIIVILSKLILLLLKADLIWFGLSGAAEFVLLSSALIVAYRIDRQRILSWKIDIQEIKSLFKASIPVFLAAVFLTVYIKLDKVLVGTMLDKTSLGYYSVGTQLSDAWIFIPAALSISFFPSILEAKKRSKKFYHNRLQLIYGFMTYVGIIIALPVSLLAKPIIGLLYGSAYLPSASVLAVYTWVLVPQCVDSVVYKWLFTENLQKYLVYRTILAAATSITLDLVLIPKYGIWGATIAAVASILVATFLSNLVFSEIRIVSIMQIKAIFAPFQFYKIYKNLRKTEKL